MTKILITGGAGFIGSNLAEKLAGQGQQVAVLDNLATGRLSNLKKIENQIQFIQADIRDLDSLRESFKGFDFVFHLAALPGVFFSVQKPDQCNQTNIEGTLNVLLAARDNKVKRVVFASSSSIYGGCFDINQEDQKPQPLSPYATSKITGEYYARNFYDLFGLETVCLRFFNVFGPHQNPESEYAAVIPLFIKLALIDQQPIIFGDGQQSRDFTFVENVIDGMILAMNSPKAAGEVFNLACGDNITVNRLVETIGQILGKKITPIYQAARPGDIYRSQANSDKIKTMLGFAPKVNFEDGLAKTIAHLQKISN
ncbi:LPS biosynthesis protein WbpP [bacterium (Candidatus Gribaldobacteria) CG_4_10_14_0_2_um_filter_41_16]|uniref:LPS biosynthesis protein WbpP n=1 Tax=bacterium (Candidatus Gribaldobacteria) CG_4_10_14_0_2_um_filter_41_16 TaxID=2014265 RepID=A0A2M7VHJ5_9BACT|nr:MAG: LPS biosynthesis protein WbpP [bacterium (Candidatus Gribaldobacteria) CG_4_10_14_0_2_um_filter_41_16]